MGLVINNNIPALQTYNTVNATSNSLQKSIQKLSTGLRINSAADDAAGLAISEKMRAQVRGLDRAVANSQDGISMIQTAEGALSETHSILQRMRELSVQSANDTLTQQDRAYIQLEIDQLREEVTRIGNTTQFNKKKLLDGSAAALWSSDRLSTKVIVNGGLRSIDQFGQKSAAEGNFVVDVNATPGKAQVQKSDVFTIKHPDVIMGVSTNAQAGINGVYVNNLPAGDYQVTLESLEQRYKFRFGSNESATARYLAEHLQLKMVGVSNTTDYTGYSWEVIDINNNTAAGTAGALTLQLVDASGNDVASGKLVFNLSTGALDPTPAASTAIATLETAGIDAKSMSFGGAIDVTQFRARGRAANDTAATILDRGTTLKFALGVGDFKAAASFGQQASGTTGGWGTGGQATLTTAGAPGTGPNDLYALSALAGLMKAEGVTSYSVEISAAGGSSGQNTFGNASVATLKIGNQTITASGTVNLSAGNSAGGAVSFDLGSGKTLSFTVTGSAANLNTDDKLVFTVNTSGAAHDASANDTYSVGDYRQGLVFSNDTELDQTHTFTLRVAKDGIDNTAGTVKFNLWVDNAQGNPTSITFNRNTGSMVYNLSDGGVVKPINFSFGLGTLDITKMREGDEVTLVTGKLAQQVGRYGTTQNVAVDASKSKSNASVLMEVVGVSDVNESVDFKVTANILNTDGSTTTRVTNLTLYNKDLALNSNEGDALNLLGLDLNLNLNLSLPTGKKVSDYYKAGDKLVYNVTPQGSQNASGASNLTSLTGVQVKGQQNSDWSAGWNASAAKAANGTPLVPAKKSVTYNDNPLKYGIDASKVNGQDVHLKNFYINEDNGTVYTGDIVLTLDKGFSTKIKTADAGDVLASFEAAYVGQVAKSDVKLRDLNKFWSSEGRFLLADAQTLTITQGDGTRASVTLYATDTLEDVATKLNTAIAKQLNQQSVLNIVDGAEDPAANRFVTFVNEDRAKEGTSEALAGTFVIRSAITGVNGEISFAGDEDLIKQLSLNEIQASEENSFSVSVWDAHSGKSVASSVKITGNKLIGVINDNVDVVFDAMANVNVEWNEPTRSFVHTKNAGSYQTIVHLADNTTVFQVGANEGEDMGINIGDMRASALGLDGVLVTDRELAARSITIIDNAIDKVSTQRAKLGAYQNRLEHTITNLTVAGENLTAAESRIRDTDMAKEMMNFTKLQIMLQAGTSMLAQANQLPQNVLSLLR